MTELATKQTSELIDSFNRINNSKCTAKFIDIAVRGVVSRQTVSINIEADKELSNLVKGVFIANDKVDVSKVRHFGMLFCWIGGDNFCPLANRMKKRVMKEMNIASFKAEDSVNLDGNAITLLEEMHTVLKNYDLKVFTERMKNSHKYMFSWTNFPTFLASSALDKLKGMMMSNSVENFFTRVFEEVLMGVRKIMKLFIIFFSLGFFLGEAFVFVRGWYTDSSFFSGVICSFQLVASILKSFIPSDLSLTMKDLKIKEVVDEVEIITHSRYLILKSANTEMAVSEAIYLLITFLVLCYARTAYAYIIYKFEQREIYRDYLTYVKADLDSLEKLVEKTKDRNSVRSYSRSSITGTNGSLASLNRKFLLTNTENIPGRSLKDDSEIKDGTIISAEVNEVIKEDRDNVWGKDQDFSIKGADVHLTEGANLLDNIIPNLGSIDSTINTIKDEASSNKSDVPLTKSQKKKQKKKQKLANQNA